MSTRRAECGRSKVPSESAPFSQWWKGARGLEVGASQAAQGAARRCQQLLPMATDPAGDLPD